MHTYCSRGNSTVVMVFIIAVEVEVRSQRIAVDAVLLLVGELPVIVI